MNKDGAGVVHCPSCGAWEVIQLQPEDRKYFAFRAGNGHIVEPKFGCEYCGETFMRKPKKTDGWADECLKCHEALAECEC